MWEFLGLESERRGSVCWPNNKIIKIDILLNFVRLRDDSLVRVQQL